MSNPASLKPNPETYAGPLTPLLPAQAGYKVRWGRLYGSSDALAINAAARLHAGPVVVITPDMQETDRLQRTLRFFLAGSDIPVAIFPDWETLPYDMFSPLPDIVSQRLATLYRLPTLRRSVLILPVATLMQRLPPRQYLDAHSLVLDVGDRLDIDETRRRLERAGYHSVSQVMEHGEFAVRGSLLDLYPMGSALPYRIDLFDDEVESIRTFDPENQRSLEKVSSLRLLPAREFPLTEATITLFRKAYRAAFPGDPQRSLIYREVSEGIASGGIEYYLPLFFDHTATLFDYLPADTLLVQCDTVRDAAEAYRDQVEERYEQRRHNTERPLLPPATLNLSPDETEAAIGPYRRITVQRPEIEAGVSTARGRVNFATKAPPAVVLQARATHPAGALEAFLGDFEGRVLFAAETAGRREALLDTLQGFGLRPRVIDGWSAFLQSDTPLAMTVAPLEQGLWLQDPDLVIITEPQLFGERVVQRRRRKAPTRDSDQIVRNLTELSIGAPVVHENHGVGRYRGLQTLAVGGMETEFLTLEYAGGDKLYVPVSSLHLISRYTGAAPEAAPLHKLGGEQWQRLKRKAAERVYDVAAELLDVYARREARKGYAFHVDREAYTAFAASFPFEETPDQQTAIDGVLADMQNHRSMDRLVCGDVGFGKTEVAMRAAFIATMDNKQVAVLVPTTLLTQQHLQNFQDRFADWPVRVESLSRFRSKKEQDTVIRDLAAGKIDIVIGTHKLLQKDIRYKDLGLVIIDEEHRFGVRQKERFKALRSEVDLLTLTATPIPRTLNMGMSGLRDLSMIATPPTDRHAIKTFISERNKALIQEACLREIKRGGQVYFLHNDVRTIDQTAREVEALVPEARVRIAHGQMRERALEAVMLDFYHRRFNVLVCTTIIESGIDVPSANTIIIHRADKLGLAQLHQIRGRVGRSHHRAYAYLVVPPKRSMTADAIKRLEAIESLEDLGAGFTLATHDLEIRGAGELLGEEQSGQIQEIGFTLYMELLERAVSALKSGRQPELDRPLEHGPEVDLQAPALLPDNYVPDVHTRLVMYKRIANAETPAELRELQVEMIDRFGLLPEATKNLIGVTEIKLRAAPLGIRKIELGAKGGRLLFESEPNIEATTIIRLIQTQPTRYKLDGTDRLRLIVEMPDAKSRLRAVEQLLDTLEKKAAA